MDTPGMSQRYGSSHLVRSVPYLAYFLYLLRHLQSRSIRNHLQTIFNHPRWRKLKKNCYDLRITIICGFITLLVLRGTMGAGKFGTPLQDVILNTGVNARQRDASIYVDALHNTSTPYLIGPSVKDWDERRRVFFKTQKPTKMRRRLKVLLVTSSRPHACDQPVGDHLLLKALKNKMDYGRVKGIEVYFNLAEMDPRMSGSWSKLPLLRRLMLSRPDVDWFWWMEPDAFISDMSFSIPFKRYRRHSLVLHGWEDLVYKKKDWVGLSTGSFLIKNNQWSIDLLDAWHVMGPTGKAREAAGKLLTSALPGRPKMEADDQSALIFLMNQNRAKWAPQIYLESSYRLYGYWAQVTKKFEEIASSAHPGYGDDRWPFVVHFLGCRACDGFKQKDIVESCIEQMDRTFNFGDNQFLRRYNYEHLSLQSSTLRKTNQTVRPV